MELPGGITASGLQTDGGKVRNIAQSLVREAAEGSPTRLPDGFTGTWQRTDDGETQDSAWLLARAAWSLSQGALGSPTEPWSLA